MERIEAEPAMEEPEVSTQGWQDAHRADSDFESTIVFLKEGTLPADSKSAKETCFNGPAILSHRWCTLPRPDRWLLVGGCPRITLLQTV